MTLDKPVDKTEWAIQYYVDGPNGERVLREYDIDAKNEQQALEYLKLYQDLANGMVVMKVKESDKT